MRKSLYSLFLSCPERSSSFSGIIPVIAFNPSADFHTYRIDYNPGVVQFYVDGNLQQTWTDGVPDASMKLLVNTWFPSWLEGLPPLTNRFTRVDWISYQQ